MKKLIMALMVTLVSCQETKVDLTNQKTIVEHANAQVEKLQKEKLEKMGNEYDGYVVKLRVEQIYVEYSGLFVVHGGLSMRGSITPILLENSGKFKDQIIAQIQRDKHNQKVFGRAMKEGSDGRYTASDLKNFRTRMYLIVKPEGIKNYDHPADGSKDESWYFKPVQVCSVGWKTCQDI